MDSRRRNRLVSLQRLNAGQDAAGQPAQTWSEVARVYANVRFLNGIESIKAGADASVAKASIRIGYRTDVTAAMRVVLGATTYEIKAVLPDEAGRQYTDLTCEVVA